MEKKGRKKKMNKKILSVLMALLLAFLILPVNIVFAADDEGTITINNVTTGDEFYVVKAFDIELDEATNSVQYYRLYDNDGTKLATRELLDASLTDVEIRTLGIAIGKKIDLNGLVTLTASDDKIKYTNETGGYVFIPKTTLDVYDVMVGFIQYTQKDGDYTIHADTINAKKNDIILDKELVNNDIVGEKQELTFKITFDVPKYPEGATDTKLVLSDILDAGFDFKTDSVTVEGLKSGEDNATIRESAYRDIKGVGEIFKYDFVYEQVKEYDQILVTYKVVVNGDLVVDGDDATNNNKAILEYSNYPHNDGNYKTIEDDVKVKTAQLKVVKTDDKEENPEKLQGAVFALYRKVTDQEVFEGLTPDAEDYVLIDTITTNENGEAVFERLAYGDYKLVETKAPFGYQRLKDPIEFTIAENAAGPDLLVERKVKNTKGFDLPHTGAAGGKVMVGLGTGFIVAGGFLFLIDKRKRDNAKA